MRESSEVSSVLRRQAVVGARRIFEESKVVLERMGSRRRVSSRPCSLLVRLSSGERLTVDIAAEGIRVLEGDARGHDDPRPSGVISVDPFTWRAVCRRMFSIHDADVAYEGDQSALLTLARLIDRAV